MRNLITALLILVAPLARAETKISLLPQVNGSGVAAGDYIPFVSTSGTPTTSRLLFSQLWSVPFSVLGPFPASLIGTHSDGQVPVADATQPSGMAWKTLQQGAKNYITYNNFENNATTGWTLGHVTLTSNLPTGTPTFGSGADSHLELLTVASGQLAGSYSLSYDSALAGGAGLVAGDFVASQAYTIDSEDQAKVLTIKLYYKFVTGTGQNFSGTSSNTFGIAIYDTANSAWIIPSGVWGMTQSSGVGYTTATFQTPSNMTSFRLVLFNANTTSATTQLYLDDISVGPQTAPFGPAMSDTQTFTPTFTAGFGTVTGMTGYYRRVGDHLEAWGTFTTGTVAASVGRIGLPSGLSIDTTKVTGNGALVGAVTDQASNSTGSTNNALLIVASGQTTTVSLSGVGTGSASGTLTENNVNTALISSQAQSFHFKVPISGWSSNVQSSADYDGNRMAFYAAPQTPTGTLNSSVNIVKFGTVTKDANAAYSTSTGKYSVISTGWYWVAFALDVSGTFASGNYVYGQVGVNGTATVGISGGVRAFGTANDLVAQGSGLVYCNAGDTLEVDSQTSATTPAFSGALGGSYFSVMRLPGSAVIQGTETIAMTAYAQIPTGTLGAAWNVVKLGTVAKDLTGNYNTSTGLFVASVPGFYDVSGTLELNHASVAVGNTFGIGVGLNGGVQHATAKKAESTSNPTQYLSVSGQVYLNPGDTTGLYSWTNGTTPSFSNSFSASSLSIKRVK